MQLISQVKYNRSDDIQDKENYLCIQTFRIYSILNDVLYGFFLGLSLVPLSLEGCIFSLSGNHPINTLNEAVSCTEVSFLVDE